jgi:hypothetical protein
VVPPPVPLTADTERLVELVFAPEHRAAVKDLLRSRCGAGVPLMDGASAGQLERLRFAVLRLSEGTMPELLRALDIANVDWRDVLVAAGFGSNLNAHRDWFDERAAR